MYKYAGRKKIGRKASHRRALVKNQMRSLFTFGKVKTTTPKAKILKANADSIVMKLSKADMTKVRSEFAGVIEDKVALEKIVKYLSADPSVKVMKVGFRSGDNAELSQVELPSFMTEKKKEVKKESKKASTKSSEKKKTEEVKDESEMKEIEKKERENFEAANEKKKGFARNISSRFTSKERSRTRSGL